MSAHFMEIPFLATFLLHLSLDRFRLFANVSQCVAETFQTNYLPPSDMRALRHHRYTNLTFLLTFIVR